MADSQIDQLQQLLNELRRQEQVLQEREEKLNIREKELEAREQELARQRPILRPKNKGLEVRPTSSVAKTVEKPKLTVEKPKLKKRHLTTSEVSSVAPSKLADSAPGISIPIPASTPEPAPMFAPMPKTQTSQSFPPTTFTFPEVSEENLLPLAFSFQPPVISFSPSAPAPLAQLSSTASTPASKPSKPKKKKKENIDFVKQPGAWLKEHRRGIVTWFAATVGAATFSNYFAYLGREAVANKFAREANSLQTQSISINADPNRLLRDKLFAEDPCRTGHAYSKIVKKYPAFVRQTPTRQLEVLALDPKIRKSINRIVIGQKPVTTGVCHLFE